MRRLSRPPVLYTHGADGIDPYWGNVVLLVDASSYANGSTPSGLDVLGRTPTWLYSAQCKTDQAIFGTSSLYFPGDNSRISFPDSPDWAMGLLDFTVEMWVRPDEAAGTERTMIGQSNVYNGYYPFSMRRNASGNASAFITDGGSIYGAAGGAMSTGAWTHVALTRYGASLYLFLNGVGTLIASGIGSIVVLDSPGNLTIGSYSDFDATPGKWKGWIDQVRITKGVARYTADFAVPTEKFPRA